MASSSEDVKPAAQPITIRVKEADATETIFKVKRSTKFHKIFDAFGQKKGVAVSAFRFTFNGEAVEGQSTPEDLEMNDNDIIDAHVAQTGGAQLQQ